MGIEKTKLTYPNFVAGKSELKQVQNDLLAQLYTEGYLAASLDSTVEKKQEIRLYFKEGAVYKWSYLQTSGLNQTEVKEIDVNDRLYLNRKFSPKQLQRIFERTLDYLENHGYPFAEVRLDSIRIDSTKAISAKLKVKKNSFYRLDSVEVNGESEISTNYLLKHLGINKGSPYQESLFEQLNLRLKELPFVELEREKEVQFFEDYVKLILWLKKKKASRFDGVLGLLTDETDGSIELTGDVDLALVNAFNRGEQIGLNWRKLKGNSQDLRIDFGLPYFLNSPFGLEANFKLFRRDTTFIDLIGRIGVNYTLRRGESFSLFLESKSSNLLSRDRFLNQSNAALPPFGDVRMNLFGVGYQLRRLDYLYNPRKGFALQSNFAVGRKRLEKIAALEEQQPNLYNDISLKTIQYNGELNLSFYVPLANRSTLLFKNQSATTYSENLYQNELMRIGGLRLLRGFDEESINVSTYSIFTFEYRFLLDRNSFFSLFADGGYYESNSIGEYVSDTPVGLGAGISFETAAGIFTFNYAVGRQFGNPIDLRAAKIHFGFINFF